MKIHEKTNKALTLAAIVCVITFLLGMVIVELIQSFTINLVIGLTVGNTVGTYLTNRYLIK